MRFVYWYNYEISIEVPTLNPETSFSWQRSHFTKLNYRFFIVISIYAKGGIKRGQKWCDGGIPGPISLNI